MWHSLEEYKETERNKDEFWSEPSVSAGRHRLASVVSQLPRGNVCAVPAPMWWHLRREEHENSELLQMSVCKE